MQLGTKYQYICILFQLWQLKQCKCTAHNDNEKVNKEENTKLHHRILS